MNQYGEKNNGLKLVHHYSNLRQRVWSMSQSYLVKDDRFNNFKEELTNRNFKRRYFPEAQSTYTLLYGEYPWSYSCEHLNLDKWYTYTPPMNVSSIEENAEKLTVLSNDVGDCLGDYKMLFPLEKSKCKERTFKKNFR